MIRINMAQVCRAAGIEGVDWDAKVGVNALSKPLPAATAEPILLKIPPGKGKAK